MRGNTQTRLHNMTIKTYREAAATAPMTSTLQDGIIFNEIFAFTGKRGARVLLSEIKSAKAPGRARYASTVYPYGMQGSIIHFLTDNQHESWSAPAGNRFMLWVTVTDSYGEEVQENGCIEIDAGNLTVCQILTELANLDLLARRLENAYSYLESIHYAITCLRVDAGCNLGLFGGLRARIVPTVGLWDRRESKGNKKRITDYEEYIREFKSTQPLELILDFLARANNAYIEITDEFNPVEAAKLHDDISEAYPYDMSEDYEMENVSEAVYKAYHGDEDGDYEELEQYILDQLDNAGIHVFRGESGAWYTFEGGIYFPVATELATMPWE